MGVKKTKIQNHKRYSSVSENVACNFKCGDTIFVPHLKKEGIIETIKHDSIGVYIGNIKMPLSISEIKTVTSKPVLSNMSVLPESSCLEDVIDLHGFYPEDALRIVEAHVLDAYTHGKPKFTVIHGKGSGRLQQVIHNYLHHAPEVLAFCFAPPSEGGSGKTIISIR